MPLKTSSKQYRENATRRQGRTSTNERRQEDISRRPEQRQATERHQTTVNDRRQDEFNLHSQQQAADRRRQARATANERHQNEFNLHSQQQEASKSWGRKQTEALTEMTRPGAEAAVRAGREIDKGLRKAASAMKQPKDTGGQHYYSNPTASGDGGGGAMDREWKNHKWISRERGKNGKWVYDYGDGAGGKKAANAHYNLRRAQDQAPSRNTGRPSRGPIDDLARGASKMAKDVSKAAGDAFNNASKAAGDAANAVSKAAGDFASAASDGANFISNAISDAIKKTPLKDLFK